MKLTVKQKLQVKSLTTKIKQEWKKSVDSLITIGQCLHDLRKLHDRKDFLSLITIELSISEVHAHRLESLFLKFGSKKTRVVLASKPSVLYILASAVDEKKLESLASGGRVKIGSKYKTLPQLTFADVTGLANKQSISNSTAKAVDVDEEDYDKRRLKNLHREFSTLLEEVNDWSLDLDRFLSEGREIVNSHLISKYIGETIECLEKLKEKLG